MSDFKRGDTHMLGKTQITILGPEDFDGYEYNYPGDKWVLAMYPNGKRSWIPKRQLESPEV